MKVIAAEEHLATAEVMDAWRGLPPEDYDDAIALYEGARGVALLDHGQGRLRWMDEMGVDIQVLSLTTPGVQSLERAQSVELARRVNDRIATMIRAEPDRFEGMAALPTPDPSAAAAELRRAVEDLGMRGGIVFGRTRDRNLDHPDNEPIFATAAELGVPLFIHPQMSRRPVREALYSGLPGNFDLALAGPGLGWHYETGVQVVRLVLSGAFDRHPGLRIVLGHWGDLVPFYLDEVDVLTKVAGAFEHRPVSEYFREHVYIAPSGTLSHRYVRWAIEVLGADRLVFALDHPFVPRAAGEVEAFLAGAPISKVEREMFAARNWEALTAATR
ncbi:MAG: amidohydrolase family protein [Actinobacteria bacterium]|nr:amidohydrolase family protein [Actinomycetota bacterium]